MNFITEGNKFVCELFKNEFQIYDFNISLKKLKSIYACYAILNGEILSPKFEIAIYMNKRINILLMVARETSSLKH